VLGVEVTAAIEPWLAKEQMVNSPTV